MTWHSRNPREVVSREREGAMEQETVTVVVAVLGIVGTLGGTFLGHFLSRSWQREEWIRDRRYEEFQELLRSLAASMHAEVEAMYASKLPPGERKGKTHETADFFRIVQTRIFTFADVKRLGLEGAWLVSVNAFYTRPDALETLRETYEELTQGLVEAATTERTKKNIWFH